MVYSERGKWKFTPDLELEKDWKKREMEDIVVKVREEVLLMLECPKKFYGWEDREFWEDYWESIEAWRKLTVLFITSFIWKPKVINLRIRKFWLKPYKMKRMKIWDKRKLKLIK